METVFATSSQVLPPPTSRNAVSIFVRAAAICAAVGSVASASSSGATSMTQAWRDLRGRRLLEEPGVDIGLGDGDALGRRQVRLDPAVDDALERDRGTSCWACWSTSCVLELGLCLGQAAGGLLGGDPAASPASGASCSMSTRSRSSSLEMDWPATLPTDARWSL